jgi:hypothetical protein
MQTLLSESHHVQHVSLPALHGSMGMQEAIWIRFGHLFLEAMSTT